MLRRRDLLAAVPAAALLGVRDAAAAPFGEASVRALAADLASRPYRAPSTDLPAGLNHLSYDAYRDLRFAPAKAIWRDAGLPFRLQMFHRGWLFRERVGLFEVERGVARPILYRPDQFTYGRVGPGKLSPELGFAGFRIHTPMGVPGRFDEVAAFLGASYFRAVSRDTTYGLSARGLAVRGGEDGEEFPAFRTFWIERPAMGARSLVVHALLDSPSVAGAFRFLITPGEPTRFDVAASLFPRRSLASAGIAPLTSMFLFDAEDARRFDDFRPRVHDSDGLAITNGHGERIWRPLSNPTALQTSAFVDDAPSGFGLLQRERRFAAYQDLEANYHHRPALWVEPLAGFGAGDVRLSELPARTETEDNIVACWRPAQPLAPGAEHRFAYRLNWGVDPAPAGALAKVGFWRLGHGGRPPRRRVVVDFAPTPGVAATEVKPQVSAQNGRISDIVVQSNPDTGGLRLSFEFDPAAAPVSDLRAALTAGGKLISEVWIHRWLA